jgi:hypothetical protein
MTDMQQLFKEIGKLQGSMAEIQKNTDKIPDLASGLLVAQNDLKTIRPKVNRHEKVMWVGSGVMAVFSVLWTGILAWVEGGHGK